MGLPSVLLTDILRDYSEGRTVIHVLVLRWYLERNGKSGIAISSAERRRWSLRGRGRVM